MEFIRLYGYPILEVVHIVGIALLFGTIWLVDISILIGRHAGLKELAKLALPWTVTGFGLAFLTGSIMLATRLNRPDQPSDVVT
jgi:uncharacterized membrane protein YdcZ (DUF606 family)